MELTQAERDNISVLLMASEHMIDCLECRKKLTDIMNHGKIPIPKHILANRLEKQS